MLDVGKFSHVERLRLLVVGSWVVGALVCTFGHDSQESIHSRCYFLNESQVSIHSRCFLKHESQEFIHSRCILWNESQESIQSRCISKWESTRESYESFTS